jgi:hypothetical protein
MRMKMGIPTALETEDRRILEDVILPYFAQNKAFSRILFIGCAVYTWHYKRIFTHKEYWTMEPNSFRAMFGAKKHIIAYMGQINQYFAEGTLDVIVCNGVIGHGLNNPTAIEDSIKKSYDCLSEGGVLVIGWNDLKQFVFLPIEECKNLQLFQPYIFPPLGTAEYLANPKWRHIYNFYIKPHKDRGITEIANN